MSKLTPWYPPEIKPVYTGPYDTRSGGETRSFMRIWNGKEWMVPVGGSFGPLLIESFPCTDQIRTWRGLAKKL